MPNYSKSSQCAQGARATIHSFDGLTKAQMVELFNHRISEPLTPGAFQRCAAAALYCWCDDVIKGRFASICSLTSKLETLEKIYHNR